VRGAGAAAALLAATAVLAAGCGGSGNASGSSTSSGSAAIGKASFIARADKVCKAAQKALAPVLKRETATLEAKPPKPAAAAQALDQAAAIVAEGRTRLKALPQPSGQAKLLATVYRALGQEAGSLRALASDVRGGHSKALGTDASKQTAFSTLYSGAAATYGFKQCGASSTG
jgi:hypothetical protein